ncbi:MAG: host attachment family protein, partial [Rhodanobacter sp.]|nr:host attachment family protein [Rhodanobacter sp.]
MHTIPAGAWVVVADGTNARLFRNVGKQDALQLTQDDLITSDAPDAQGEGPSGHRPPEASVEQTHGATFAKQLA